MVVTTGGAPKSTGRGPGCCSMPHSAQDGCQDRERSEVENSDFSAISKTQLMKTSKYMVLCRLCYHYVGFFKEEAYTSLC